MKEQSKQTFDIIDDFHTAAIGQDMKKMVEILTESPAILQRNDEYEVTYNLIRDEINRSASWQEIEMLLPFMRPNDAIELVNQAVKLRLKVEYESSRLLMGPEDVKLFVSKTISGSYITTCYKKLLSDALRLDSSEEMPLQLIKMDIADQLIRAISQRAMKRTNDRLESLQAQLNEAAMRRKFNTVNCHFFGLPEDMKKMHDVLYWTREVTEIRIKCCENRADNEISAHTEVQQLLCQMVASYGEKIANIQNLDFYFSDFNQKACANSLKELCAAAHECFKLLQGNSSTKEAVEKSINHLDELFKKATSEFDTLQQNLQQMPRYPTQSEAALFTLNSRKALELFVFFRDLKEIIIQNFKQLPPPEHLS